MADKRAPAAVAPEAARCEHEWHFFCGPDDDAGVMRCAKCGEWHNYSPAKAQTAAPAEAARDWERINSVCDTGQLGDAAPAEAPHEQHHLSTSDAITQHAPTPEAPPTQDDDLVARLNQACEDYTQFWGSGDLYGEAAARIESDDQIIKSLRAEVARRKGDPVTRLHNLCEGMEQDRHDSPYSAEAWEAQDAAYREKCAELAASRGRERALREMFKDGYVLALYDDHGSQVNAWHSPEEFIATIATPDSAASPTDAANRSA